MIGRTLLSLSTIWGSNSIRPHLVHQGSTHGLRLCSGSVELHALYHAPLPWLRHHRWLELEPVLRRGGCVALPLKHPRLPLPKHGRAQPRLLAQLPPAAREGHLRGICRAGCRVPWRLADGGGEGGLARAVDRTESSGAFSRLRARRRLQLRREVRGSASRNSRRRVDLHGGNDGGQGDLGVGVRRDGIRGGELVGLLRCGGG
uniref:Uncharacterized protein n=1 Tax=Triticum urartu TaxID=4572 RepID=A0A8R7QRM1_TRIUA